MRYKSRPKPNLSSAGTNADSCMYVILLLLLLLLVLQNAGSDTGGKPNLHRNEHLEQGCKQILLRSSLSLEKRAVGRDTVNHGSGYLPPA